MLFKIKWGKRSSGVVLELWLTRLFFSSRMLLHTHQRWAWALCYMPAVEADLHRTLHTSFSFCCAWQPGTVWVNLTGSLRHRDQHFSLFNTLVAEALSHSASVCQSRSQTSGKRIVYSGAGCQMQYFHLLPTPSCGNNYWDQNEHPYEAEGPQTRSRKANWFCQDTGFCCALVERTLDLESEDLETVSHGCAHILLESQGSHLKIPLPHGTVTGTEWHEVWDSTLWPFKRNPQTHQNDNSAGQDSLGKTISSLGPKT